MSEDKNKEITVDMLKAVLQNPFACIAYDGISFFIARRRDFESTRGRHWSVPVVMALTREDLGSLEPESDWVNPDDEAYVGALAQLNGSELGLKRLCDKDLRRKAGRL